MIQEDFIEFSQYNSYQLYKEEINPESIVFISEPGQERLIANSKEYMLVPSDGKSDQVLKRTLSGIAWKWDKECNVSRTKDVTKIPYNVNFFIPSIGSSDSCTLGVEGTMIEGHECHIIVDNYKDFVFTIAIPNGGDYVNITGVDVISINPGEYAEINILSDGKKMYIRAIS